MAVRVAPLRPDRMAHLLAGVAGFLLAAAFLDLIPHVAEEAGARWLPFVFVGYLLVYAAESLFPAHLHPDEHAEHRPAGNAARKARGGRGSRGGLPSGGPAAFFAALGGLSVHAFFDGVALMGSFAAGLSSGVLVLLAVTFHKFPVGFSLGALGRGGARSGSLAGWSGGVLALATLIGALTVLLLGNLAAGAEPGLLPLAAGALIYIGATDMIPASHGETGRAQGVYSLLGAIAFYLSLLLVRSAGLG
ncbi:ZIP family metal transporter [Limnochorda pilosa]|uniref:ZIP family metal transporter n=1 Tax=Limnochorda pilosa TaxID=1555112 RepID=UPI001187355E|nr:ZIP family metal transporter [Limnochorda pilosa]